MMDHDLDAARGIMLAVALSAAFWVVAGFIVFRWFAW